MALTRKFLKGMGIEDEKVESIIEAHSETVEGLTKERDTLRAQAEKVPDLQKQLEDAKAAAGDPNEWEQKYNAEHQALEDFKAQVAAEKADAEKAQAYRGMLAKAGIDPKLLDDIMAVTNLADVEMEDGQLKDAGKLEEAAKEKWANFMVRTKTVTPTPETPPKTDNVPEGADPELAKRMMERHNQMFGKPTTKE